MDCKVNSETHLNGTGIQEGATVRYSDLLNWVWALFVVNMNLMLFSFAKCVNLQLQTLPIFPGFKSD